MSISKGLSSIAKAVLEDVEKEVESMILKAESQAEKILEEGEKAAKEKFRSIVNEGEEKIEAERKERTTLFEIKTRNKLLQEQEEIVEAVFEETLNHLGEYALTREYQDCLAGLIAEACKQINAGKLVMYLNRNDCAAITEEMIKNLSKNTGFELVKSDKLIDVVGGVVVESSDGKIVVNNTFENRLNMLRSSLRAKIANMLFEEESKSQPME